MKNIILMIFVVLSMLLGITVQGSAYQRVQRNPYIISIMDVGKNITVNDRYTTPVNVDAKYSNGAMKNVKVYWESKKIDTSVPGLYKIYGTAMGYSKKVTFLLTVNKKELGIMDIPDYGSSINQFSMFIYKPSVITATMEDSTQKQVPVTWDEDNIDTSIVGKYVILGTVKNYSKRVKMNVTIVSFEPEYTYSKFENARDFIMLSNTLDATQEISDFSPVDSIYLNFKLINSGTDPSLTVPALDIMLDDNKIELTNYSTHSEGDTIIFKNVLIGRVKQGKHKLSICINKDHSIPESNYEDDSTAIDFTVSTASELSKDYFTDKIGGYRFKLPNRWVMKPVANKPQNCISISQFIEENNGQAFIGWSVYTTNIKQLTEDIVSYLSDYIVQNTLSPTNKFKEESRKTILVNNDTGYQINYEGEYIDENNQTNALSEQVYMILHNDKLYVGCYAVGGELKEDYGEMLNNSMKTFEFTN